MTLLQSVVERWSVTRSAWRGIRAYLHLRYRRGFGIGREFISALIYYTGHGPAS